MNNIHNGHNVQMFWNFFPFDMFVWGFAKYIGNSFFFWAYPFVEPLALAWNFIPDTSIFIIWLALDIVIALSGAIFLFDIIAMTILEYFYLTALPDWFIAFLISLLGFVAVGIIFGLTGGTFSFSNLGTGAWLTTSTS